MSTSRTLRGLRGNRIVQAIYRTAYPPIYERYFRSPNGYTLCRGVFYTFQEALASAPAGSVVDIDDPRVAQRYRLEFEQSADRLPSYEYPAMFWLARILDAERATPPIVLDVGGNLGVHYYQWSKYLEFPDDLRWIVCDLPEILRVGRELAHQRDTTAIEFVASLSRQPAATVLHSSGALQLMENWECLLDPLADKPRHLLLNRLPLHETKEFVTLVNVGDGVFCPQRVFSRGGFIETFVREGYTLIDSWEDHADACEIPFHEGYSVAAYTGLYLKLRTDAMKRL